MTNKPNSSLTLAQAVDQTPLLQQLSQQMAAGSARLAVILPLLPPPLRTGVQAGPLREREWCLLVPHQASAAKIRQLLPTLCAALRNANHPIDSIRIRVRKATG